MRPRMNSKAGLPLALACLLLLVFAAPLSRASAAENVQISVGGQKILKLDRAIGRVALSNPKVVDVKVVNSRQLRLLGQGAGSTDLTVWYAGDETSLSYRVVVGADIAGLEGAFAAEPAFGEVKVSNTGKSTVLKGKVYSLADRARAADLAASYVGKDVRNLLEVSQQRMVAVEIRFAAVSVSTMKALGINFRTLGNGFQFAGTGPGTAGAITTPPAGGIDITPGLPIANAFNLFLSWPSSNTLGIISALSNANLAQLLAEPTLLVRSGEEADFLAGGEIPIPVPQSGVGTGSVTIEYKKFGVQLNVAATVLDNDQIVLKVNPEVSELDRTNGIQVQGYDIPAIRTRSTRTTVELGDGQSFILAGLMFTSSSDMEDKVPGLGDLPVIGALFKRSVNTQEQQELVIVATPHLVSPMEAGTVPKLPGEGVPKFDSSLGQKLLNVKQLDDHTVQYGLMR